VHVRRSARARGSRALFRPGTPPEIVVPAGASERTVDRAIASHRDWLAARLAAAPPPVLDPPRLTEAVGRQLARSLLERACECEAAELGVRYCRIQVRDTRSRWGSCSSTGTLSFSWRLVLAPAEVLDYVVVHELCHLRVADHSPRFWRLVERRRPGYRDQREWLGRHGWELLAYRPERA
jgi:predicted metal-dependent hydrolase